MFEYLEDNGAISIAEGLSIQSPEFNSSAVLDQGRIKTANLSRDHVIRFLTMGKSLRQPLAVTLSEGMITTLPSVRVLNSSAHSGRPLP